MIVDYEKAIEIFDKIAPDKKSFYYSPYYIKACADSEEKLKPIFFVKEENEGIFYHAALIGDTPFENYNDIQTPYGYGGPLIDGTQNFADRAFLEYKNMCKESKVLVEFIRFHPVVSNSEMYYGKKLVNRKTVAINLTVENLLKTCSSRVKSAIKIARINEISIIFNKDQKYLDAFHKIYIDLMNEKNTLEEYFFSKKYIEHLLKSDKVFLCSAINKDNEVIGSSLFFYESAIADYHLSATTHEGKKSNVSALMIIEFAEFIKKKGAKWLYLGGGNDSSEDNSLLFFKKGFSKIIFNYNIGYYIFNEKYFDYERKFYSDNEVKQKRILFYR